MMLPALLALMALGLDGAQIFLERRDAQAAADLAALAGALSLPDDEPQARADAKAIGAANGYDPAQVIPVTAYGGDPDRIQVTVDASVTTFFLPILDMFLPGDYSTVEVSARAVAEVDVGSGYGDAIFAAEPACPDDPKLVLEWTGEQIIINGGIHSNGGISVPPQGGQANGGTSYSCEDAFDDRGGVVFDPPAAPTEGGATREWPSPHELSEFTCTTFEGVPADGEWNVGADEGDWWVGGRRNATSPPTLESGTYCATGPNGSIKLSGGADIVGEVTFIATGTIDIQLGSGELTPHEEDVLVFSLEGDAIVSGNASTWDGLIYAPNGTATVSGQSDTVLTGGVHAWNVVLAGNGFRIINEIEGGGPASIALVE
jgi:hypothetical protein